MLLNSSPEKDHPISVHATTEFSHYVKLLKTSTEYKIKPLASPEKPSTKANFKSKDWVETLMTFQLQKPAIKLP